MQRLVPLIFLCGCSLALSTTAVRAAAGLGVSESRFYYKDASGKTTSVRIIRRYWRVPVVHPFAKNWPVPIVHPFAKIDPRIDPKLRRAATIAEERANARSHARCWHYVKDALVAAGVINSYPKTAYAIEASQELVRDYGFTRLSMHDPYAAPLGAVLVYGDRNRGHVEIRTNDGFVSDYHSKDACSYRLVAIYGKYSS